MEKIVRLSTSDVRLSDPDEDVRGWRVVDRTEAPLGTVDDLFVDEKGRPHFVLVKVENSPHGDQHVVVPANAIRLMANDTLLVNEFRNHVLSAPDYDPERHQEPRRLERTLRLLRHLSVLRPWLRGGLTFWTAVRLTR